MFLRKKTKRGKVKNKILDKWLQRFNTNAFSKKKMAVTLRE